MIIYIEQCDREHNRELLKQYYQLRKKIFCDQYGWVTANPDGTETDHLDEGYNIFVLYVDPATNQVAGGVRLLPTTGQTLLHTVWKDMLPHPDDFRSPNIWEATRFCVDEDSFNSRNKNFLNKVALALIVAVLDLSIANGISQIIAICEQKFFGIFGTYGGTPEVLCQKTDENGCDIACCLWSTDESLQGVIKWARPFLGTVDPIKIKAA